MIVQALFITGFSSAFIILRYRYQIKNRQAIYRQSNIIAECSVRHASKVNQMTAQLKERDSTAHMVIQKKNSLTPGAQSGRFEIFR